MTTVRIGYARCSTDTQGLTAQRTALVELGVEPTRIYTDHGLTGRHRDRPGLDQALAATLYDPGEYSISDLAELFAVSRPTVYRTLQRTANPTSL